MKDNTAEAPYSRPTTHPRYWTVAQRVAAFKEGMKQDELEREAVASADEETVDVENDNVETT